MVLPPQLPAGDHGVVVGERLLADAGPDLGQQAAGAAARFGGPAVIQAGPTTRVFGSWTFGDHGAV